MGDQVLGRDIYNQRCYFCHGYSGDARTVASLYLDPRPRAFTGLSVQAVERAKMLETVRKGISGSAMMAFESLLTEHEIVSVVDYIRAAFLVGKEENTRYHTADNGWPEHERYRDAFPFVRGEIALERPEADLTLAQREGKRLFLSSCITCHEQAIATPLRHDWSARAVSFPRGGYDHRRGAMDTASDAISGASPYARHEIPPVLTDLSPDEALGERLFQSNCAFCHAADGSGRNWIGSFLDPPPRDLTDARFIGTLDRARLRRVIREGLPGTTMSAWKQVLSEAQIEALLAYIDRAFGPLAP